MTGFQIPLMEKKILDDIKVMCSQAKAVIKESHFLQGKKATKLVAFVLTDTVHVTIQTTQIISLLPTH